jgi:hypothetical protein
MSARRVHAKSPDAVGEANSIAVTFAIQARIKYKRHPENLPLSSPAGAMAKSSSSRGLRLVVYTITAALSVVCIGLAINALVKSVRPCLILHPT